MTLQLNKNDPSKTQRLGILSSLLLLLLSTPVCAQIVVDGRLCSVEECYQTSIELEGKQQYREASNYINLAANYLWEKKEYDQAIEFYQRSINLNKQIGNASGIARIESNLGMIYADKGAYLTALTYFEKTLQQRELEKQYLSIISAKVNISVVLNQLRRYDESLTHLQEALKIASQANDRDQMRSCYGLLAETYEKKGDQKQAMRYFDYYRAVQDNIQKDKETKIQAAIDKVQHEITLTQSEKEEKEVLLKVKERELQTQKNKIYVIDSTNKLLQEQASAASLQIRLLESEEVINGLTRLKIEEELNQEKKFTTIVAIALSIALCFLFIVGFMLLKIYRMNRLLSERNSIIIGQKDRLMEENRVRTKLLSILSHDLRTPLSGVHLIVQLIRSKTLPQELIDKQLIKLDESLTLTFQMLENMLFWAKSQLNGIGTKPEIITLESVVSSNVELLTNTIQNKHIVVEQEVKNLQIYADVEKVNSIIRNLLVNAIKFTPDGGTISLTAKRKTNMVELSIRDTGVGIAKELQHKIFTTELKSTKGTNQESGSGLGLVLCSDFAKSCGGTLRFESEEGKGTCFFLELPCQ